MKNKTILKRISETSPVFRAALAKECQLHSEKQCNGEYYFDENIGATGAWVGYTGAPDFKHGIANAQAVEGATREADILKKLLQLTGTKELPDFIGYNGDPRGFVLKILADKLTPDEVEYCRMDCDFMKDWGGDFSIIKDSEWQ